MSDKERNRRELEDYDRLIRSMVKAVTEPSPEELDAFVQSQVERGVKPGQAGEPGFQLYPFRKEGRHGAR